MSIKTDAVVIRDETTTGANTATRVGTNLVDIADDLVAKQAAIDLNTAKVGITAQQASDITTNNAKVGVTTEEANPDVVGQAEAEAGTATTERIWTAERVKQAIVALGGSGSVDDTAYGISWDGVTGTAPSKNALYDFIESQVFKVDATSNIIPIFWGGTQAEYDIDFPSGHTNEYFIVITDGIPPSLSASDITDFDTEVSNNIDVADNSTKISFDSTSSTRLANTSGTNTGDNAANTTYANDYRAANFIADTDYLSPTTASTTYAPVLGADDNYVTDAEKVVIGNTSNTNTGDNAVNTLYSGLVGVTTEEANTIDSEPIGNEAQILQVVSISQANYDLITPVATTLYVING